MRNRTKDTCILILVVLFFNGGCDKDNSTGIITEPPPAPLPLFFDHPAWHPDGEWIAAEHVDSLDSDGDGQRDQRFGGIWLVHSESGETQPLIRGFSLPAWSPDGKKLALVRAGQIFTVTVSSLEPARVDTNSLKKLTNDGANFYPAWSPDGEWIAYDSNLQDPVGANVIWKMRNDGSFKIDISQHQVGEWRMPNWSPNGKHIVHQRYVGVNYPEIVVMDTSGENSVRLTFDDHIDAQPKYSPDGKTIAFYSQSRVGPSAIWVMNSEGSSLRKVSEYAWRFDWSPDGKKMVFLFLDFLNPRPGNGELWLVNADGIGLRQLTHFKNN